MKRLMFSLGFVLALSGGSFPFAEATKSDDPQMADVRLHHEVTVTASPVKKAVKDCSVSVSVMDENDIRTVRPLKAPGAPPHIVGETFWIYTDLSGLAAGFYEMPGRNAHCGVRIGL